MQHLDMEDMLSPSLRNILRSLLQEDVLINCHIFGGEETVILLKCETPSQPLLNAEALKHSRPQM